MSPKEQVRDGSAIETQPCARKSLPWPGCHLRGPQTITHLVVLPVIIAAAFCMSPARRDWLLAHHGAPLAASPVREGWGRCPRDACEPYAARGLRCVRQLLEAHIPCPGQPGIVGRNQNSLLQPAHARCASAERPRVTSMSYRPSNSQTALRHAFVGDLTIRFDRADWLRRKRWKGARCLPGPRLLPSRASGVSAPWPLAPGRGTATRGSRLRTARGVGRVGGRHEG